MKTTDPQFLYMVLVLPSLFGLTLLIEGLTKVLKSRLIGFVSIIFGMLFIVIAVFGYLFFSNNFSI